MPTEHMLMNARFGVDLKTDETPLDALSMPINDKTPKANPAEGGTAKMLQRFANPSGESGNPFIGGVIRTLQEEGGIAPPQTVATRTGRPLEQIVLLGKQLKGVFNLEGGNLTSPFLTPKPATQSN